MMHELLQHKQQKDQREMMHEWAKLYNGLLLIVKTITDLSYQHELLITAKGV